MKKVLVLFALSVFFLNTGWTQIYEGDQANSLVKGAQVIRLNQNTHIPDYIEFRSDITIRPGDFVSWLSKTFNMDAAFNFQLLSTENDQIGYIHYRYQQTYQGYPIDKSMYILHVKDNRIYSMNGLAFDKISVSVNQIINESSALQIALGNINATLYKWQESESEQMLKNETNNIESTFYPKADLVFISANKDMKSNQLRLAYKFNIYADIPLSRMNYYIDAGNGNILFTENLIYTKNEQAIAYTRYSGKQTITTDSFAKSLYRLRDATRGKGVQTYNLQKGYTYVNTDFIDSDNVWNNKNANMDDAATDAHWGAEKTYDYYWDSFNRNSIDNKGLALLNYVHYGVNYNNAFWDGQRMTFGDGNGNPFTLLDVTGHEITHGLTSYTASLISQNESGALNESFSDIFGTSIEFASRPTNANWIIGDTILNIRYLNNPNINGFPDTYFGNYWDSINNEVHKNSTVQSYWFYLLCEGGSGTNDKNNTYNVTKIGMGKASRIAYRTLTLYLTPNSAYSDAHFYSIKAASDLYGVCSPEVTSVMEAWYAVGIGSKARKADFSTLQTTHCRTPFTVNFNNSAEGFTTYLWKFGDGFTSTAQNASHTYTNYGKYNVTLSAYTGCGINDSVTKTNYIDIDQTLHCEYLMPSTNSKDSTDACSGTLYDNGGEYGNYSNNLDAVFTINSAGASSIRLIFKSFQFETTNDYLNIYDGPNTKSPLIGKYTGYTLPNTNGIVSSTGSAITIVQYSNSTNNYPGFELDWQCNNPNLPPVASFSSDITSSCFGQINFYDKSYNTPNSWLWDFGDGIKSSKQNPSHIYSNSGLYTVKLNIANSHGMDSSFKTNYIIISLLPNGPIANNYERCGPGAASLTAKGWGILNWYDDPESVIPLDTGKSLTTSILSKTTDFFVQSQTINPMKYVGPINDSVGSGNYYNSQNEVLVYFKVIKSLLLSSFKLYSSAPDNKELIIYDSIGNIIYDSTYKLATGVSRIYINKELPVGNNYRINIKNPNNLFRNTSSITYPYTISGLISITGHNDYANPNYYYFFYNWEIMEMNCRSERTKITVFIDTIPKADFNYAIVGPTSLIFYNKTLNCRHFSWDFGDGQTADNIVNPSHYYANYGTYQVKLIAKTSCGKDSLIQSIALLNSIENKNLFSYLQIYPVPTKDYLVIDFKTFYNQDITLRINSILGQTIFTKYLKNVSTYNNNIELGNLEQGSYFIQLITDQGVLVRKIIVER